MTTIVARRRRTRKKNPEKTGLIWKKKLALLTKEKKLRIRFEVTAIVIGTGSAAVIITAKEDLLQRNESNSVFFLFV